MNLLSFFLYDLGWHCNNDAVDKFDITDDLKRDSSKFIYVDGEEGDYGDITYWKDDKLIATVSISSDTEDVTFTKEGRKLFSECAIKAFNDSVKKINGEVDSLDV